ncbi:SH3-containing GRB2-like protein 3-interacting protein 1 isoform X3 [Phyllopteryx taeniolatus]|uniref:SH3-containing GRB2-like protein 3-interacting protein 1 isoform X3 n=1 Tax=Phyllopteryx taeniolatus TaxID=161469 RepID=UPI002AD4CF23|nr:SH3-containing GRB2-like protein 3-interacting protein 1 isoform X3 [Phyllopteryx taeniolatus]
MMEGLKKRTRKAFGIRKKEKDNDSTGSPDREGGEPQEVESSQRKANGAPNGFYGEIDWERYNSPEVDEEGYSIRPEDEADQPNCPKSHFFSSDESEEEEDHRKKFKIKIKPLPSDQVVAVPSFEELKASVGNIALSPSPLRHSLGLKRNTSSEEIVRPRRVVPTVAPIAAPAPQAPSRQTPASEESTNLFGPPLETAFGEQKLEVVLSESDVWGASESEPESSLTRPFPTGTPPPLPPKNVPTSPLTTDPASADDNDLSTEAENSTRKTSIADLDHLFGPEQAPPAKEDTDDTWVCFSEQSSDWPPLPKEPAPPLSFSTPPPEEAAPPLPASPPPPKSPAPPLPGSPPPSEDTAPHRPKPPSPKEVQISPLVISPPPSEDPTAPSKPSGPSKHEDGNLLSPNTSSLPSPKEYVSPPTSTHPPVDSPACIPTAPKASTALSVTSPDMHTARCSNPPIQTKNTDGTPPNEDEGEIATSPKDSSHGSRTTPPPPPPPTYRAVVSSPGPTSGAGSSSPVRPATPSIVNPTPPPPPPRPPSRPKLPPGKPNVGDTNRPCSPAVHAASPPPVAPLARAESTSSISSTNSLSAATTPTISKDLSVSEDDAYVDKLPSFERHFDSFAENDQPSLVWFDRGKFYLTFEGCSRGPSPLTMGAQDTLPVAAAFTETVNAFFKGADPSKCVVKIIGEMVLSFPAGITRHFANNPSPAVLTFSITNYNRLEHVLPNPQLLCCDTATQAKADAKDFWVNMPNLIAHLKKVSEQKPQATYYNVDMLKYQVSVQGPVSTPINLAMSWRCEPTSTDLRIDYKYNGEAMSTPMALNNVQFLVPVDGGVSKLQAVLPTAAWNAEQQRILWKIPDISQKSENGGVGSLLARFQLTEGPSKPAPLAVQFTSEGSTLSGCDIELAGPGYRFSLVKKRFAAGKYLADN